MNKRARSIRAVLLCLFLAAVAFAIGVIYELNDAVDEIQTTEHADPLWIGAQLQFEILRLQRSVGEFGLGQISANDVAMRFDIAWSRIIVLQEGRLPQILADIDIDLSPLTRFEARLIALEAEFEALRGATFDAAARQQTAIALLAALDGADTTIREFLFALADAKSVSMAAFRTSLISLSTTMAYLSVTILGLLGLFIFLLLLELRAARATEKAMRALAREVTSASRLKMNFMSVVSHELRTPLTSILGGLSLLKVRLGKMIDDEPTLKLLDVASRNGDRLLALVNDILDVQALSEGKVSVERERTNLNDIVATAVESCQIYAQNLGVSYRVTTPEETLEAMTDSSRVTQVLINLISNAAKFTSDGDTVEVDLKRIGQTARIEVTDHGIGIPGDRQDAIFTPFHQVNPGTTVGNKSSGLGLSIARQLMTLLGGEIGFVSVEGEGSTFWIELELL